MGIDTLCIKEHWIGYLTITQNRLQEKKILLDTKNIFNDKRINALKRYLKQNKK